MMVYYGKYFDQNRVEIKEGTTLQIGDNQEIVTDYFGRLYLDQYPLSDFGCKFIGRDRMKINGFVVISKWK